MSQANLRSVVSNARRIDKGEVIETKSIIEVVQLLSDADVVNHLLQGIEIKDTSELMRWIIVEFGYRMSLGIAENNGYDNSPVRHALWLGLNDYLKNTEENEGE